METIIKKYTYLPPEQFGSIVKIIIEYSETGQIKGNTRDMGVRTKSWTKQRPQGGSRYIVHIRKESPRPAII